MFCVPEKNSKNILAPLSVQPREKGITCHIHALIQENIKRKPGIHKMNNKPKKEKKTN